MTQAYNKPLPVPQVESDVYWQKAKEGELHLRSCNACGDGKAYFYPRDISPCCFSKDTTWIKASGKATLYTYAVVMRPPHPGFMNDIPFITALVELEEGPIMPTNIVLDDDAKQTLSGDPSSDILRIGMPLEVVFEDVTDAIALPKFKPA